MKVLRIAIRCGAVWIALLIFDGIAAYWSSTFPAMQLPAEALWWHALLVVVMWLIQLPLVLLAGFSFAFLRSPKAQAWPWTGCTALWLLWACTVGFGFLVTLVPVLGALGFMLLLIVGYFSSAIAAVVLLVLAVLAVAEAGRRRIWRQAEPVFAVAEAERPEPPIHTQPLRSAVPREDNAA